MLGSLFAVGDRLAQISNSPASSQFGEYALQTHVEGDGSLRLVASIVSNNRDQLYEQMKRGLRHEYRCRNADLSAVKKQLDAMWEMTEEDEDELGAEVARLLAIKGQHARRIEQLEKLESVRINYQRTTTTASIALQPGVAAKVSWCEAPVIWLPNRQMLEEVSGLLVEDVSEEMPIQASAKGGIHVLGGQTSKAPGSTQYLIYDRSEQTWTTLPPMIRDRSCHCAAVVNGMVYVAGGETALLRRAERFDAISNQWSSFQTRPRMDGRQLERSSAVSSMSRVVRVCLLWSDSIRAPTRGHMWATCRRSALTTP